MSKRIVNRSWARKLVSKPLIATELIGLQVRRSAPPQKTDLPYRPCCADCGARTDSALAAGRVRELKAGDTVAIPGQPDQRLVLRAPCLSAVCQNCWGPGESQPAISAAKAFRL